MSTRYGDRGSDRYEDADDERYGGRDYERSRDYGYGRDHDTRDYGGRDYETGPGREGILGGYAGAPPSRRYEDYGREYERGPARDYGRDYGREPARDYGRESARDYGRDYDRVRGFDTDYGRTTSRFYGRSGYDYGREDYDRYGGRPDERGTGRGRRDRGWWDRASDEVLSWFGDEDAERRRRIDDLREGRGRGTGKFRGRGPKNYRRSDERIREEINDRMTENEWLDASDVEVVVLGGEVTLSGTVDSRYAKRLAEDIADSVSGVGNVQNNLRVRDYEAVAPAPGNQAPAPGAGDTTLASDTPDAGTTGRASKAAGRG